MSSPTVLFILDRLWKQGGLAVNEGGGAAPRPTVAIAFGPGLIAEAALLS